MAERTRRTRRRRNQVEEPEVEDVEEEEVDDVEEEVEAKPVAKKRGKKRSGRRVVIKEAEPIDDDEDDDDFQDDDDGPEVVVRQSEPEDDETLTVGLVSDNPILAVLESMRKGEMVTIIRITRDQWAMSTASPSTNKVVARAAGRLTGSEYDRTVCTEEYIEWQNQWQTLSTEEKMKEAKKAKLKWEESDAANINIMRVGMAMREHLGIEKFKPQYQTISARKAIRG